MWNLRGLIGYAKKFAEKVGDKLIDRSIDSWMPSGAGGSGGSSEDIRPSARARGFTGEVIPVYQSTGAGSAFFAMAHADGVNAYMPFFNGGALAAVVEGPTVFALSQAVSEWPSVRPELAAARLVPRAAFRWNGACFERHFPRAGEGAGLSASWSEPIYYETLAGAFRVTYEARPFRQGFVQLAIVECGGRVVFNSAYDVTW